MKIKVKLGHAIITDRSRAQLGDRSAFEAAIQLIRDEYLKWTRYNPRGQFQTFHVLLVVDPTDSDILTEKEIEAQE